MVLFPVYPGEIIPSVSWRNSQCILHASWEAGNADVGTGGVQPQHWEGGAEMLDPGMLDPGMLDASEVEILPLPPRDTRLNEFLVVNYSQCLAGGQQEGGGKDGFAVGISLQ